MENHRLKIKLGDFEFEAEGPEAVVQAQFDAFRELVLNAPASINTAQQSASAAGAAEGQESNRQNDPGAVDEQLEQITKLEDRIVSLTVPPNTIDDSILLILLGQKILRSNDNVKGAELTTGLRMSGQRVERVDRLLDKASDRGEIIVVGQHRAKRYRLTNRGLSKARGIAKEQIAIVA